MSFWKILRVLTTDKCNYNCIYCHNEGQTGKNITKDMTLNEFIDVVTNLEDSGIEEIRFSGGEPLVNKQTIDIILTIAFLIFLLFIIPTIANNATSPIPTNTLFLKYSYL